MAGKKRKPTLKSRKKDYDLKINLIKTAVGLSVLVIMVFAGGFLAHRWIPPRPSEHPPSKNIVQKKRVYKIPEYEIYPQKGLEYKPLSKTKTIPAQKLPQVAIIIDDLGYDPNIAKKFLALNAVFTLSVLPYSPFKESIVKAGREKGYEIMIHLPMEPNEYPRIKPGRGALLTSMSPDQLIDQLNKTLDDVPFVTGVNNHMGSKMTTISSQMNQIFSVLKTRGLFFIDSRTTSQTLCGQSARLLQVPFAQRNVFLDHLQEPDFIRNRIERLVQIATIHGEAIGIAHPHPTTYEVLRAALPEIQKKVLLVSASSVVHIID
jgi:polysaccharide deacetylase 2 family uncharacterized protein YibQ